MNIEDFLIDLDDACESATADIKKDYKASIKVARTAIKDARKLLKSGDGAAASAKCDEAIKSLNEFKARVAATDTAGDNMVVENLKTILPSLLLAVVTLAAGVGVARKARGASKDLKADAARKTSGVASMDDRLERDRLAPMTDRNIQRVQHLRDARTQMNDAAKSAHRKSTANTAAGAAGVAGAAGAGIKTVSTLVTLAKSIKNGENLSVQACIKAVDVAIKTLQTIKGECGRRDDRRAEEAVQMDEFFMGIESFFIDDVVESDDDCAVNYIGLEGLLGLGLDDLEACEMYVDVVCQYQTCVPATEGINKDAIKLKRDYKAQIKTAMKTCKAAKKAGNIAEAQKQCDEAARLVQEFKKEAESLASDPQSAGNVLCGYLTRVVRNMGLALIGPFGVPALVRDTITDLNNLATNIKKFAKSELELKDLNKYTTLLYKSCDKYLVAISRMKRELANADADTDARESDISIDNLIDMGFDYDEAVEAFESIVE